MMLFKILINTKQTLLAYISTDVKIEWNFIYMIVMIRSCKSMVALIKFTFEKK